MRKISPPPGFDPRTVQAEASRYTDWATGPTELICKLSKPTILLGVWHHVKVILEWNPKKFTRKRSGPGVQPWICRRQPNGEANHDTSRHLHLDRFPAGTKNRKKQQKRFFVLLLFLPVRNVYSCTVSSHTRIVSICLQAFSNTPTVTYNRNAINKCCSRNKFCIHVSSIVSFRALTFSSLAVSLRTTRFNIQKFYMVLALRLVFCLDLRTDSDSWFTHHWLIGFYNRGGKCLQRGTDWFFI